MKKKKNNKNKKIVSNTYLTTDLDGLTNSSSCVNDFYFYLSPDTDIQKNQRNERYNTSRSLLSSDDFEHSTNFLNIKTELINKKTIDEITEPIIKEQVLELLATLQNVFLELEKNRNVRDMNFPPLSISKDEDQAILFEWIFKDFKIGFNLEKKKEESGYYLVSNKINNKFSKHGFLNSISNKYKFITELFICIIEDM